MLIAESQVELYWQNLVSGTTIIHLESESSSVGRASAFQAEGRGFESRLPLTAYIAQAVEHFLGKEEVTSSSLVVGSFVLKENK